MVNSFYTRLTSDQVTAVYRLVILLRRLRVIGTLELSTVSAIPPIEAIGHYDIIDMTSAIYGIEKVGYDPYKGKQDAEELLEQIFGRLNVKFRGVP